MRTISTREFTANPDRYFDMAREQGVCIQKGSEMFHLLYAPAADLQPPLLEPDDDFHRALTAEEFRKSVVEVVEKVHRKFYGDERKVCPGNT